MSAKNRAISNTENEFQAALATYTKAGNKTAAMRRLWNAAYEIGRLAAEAAAPAVLAVVEVSTELVKEKKSKRVEETKKIGFAEGRQAGFEEGRESAMTADAFALSFEAGKTAGLASGMESGRETEEKRWENAGHFADGTCRAFAPRRAQKILGLSIGPTTRNPSPSTPFCPVYDNRAIFLACDQARQTRSIRYGDGTRDITGHGGGRDNNNTNDFILRKCTPVLDSARRKLRTKVLLSRPRSKAISEGQLSVFGILVWFWMMLRERVALG
ncbi:hypothetical protein B0H13DRAFT_1946481 [Mycena leptocephala]|nr:hypothetical protein B0H13DRAFT_1946481 [Mycena leptocephala]